MGSPLNAAEAAKAEFMYSVLDYSSWHLYIDGECIGGVLLNSTDQSASFWAHDFESPITEFLSQRSFRWWVSWLQNHVQA